MYRNKEFQCRYSPHIFLNGNRNGTKHCGCIFYINLNPPIEIEKRCESLNISPNKFASDIII